MYLAHLEKLNRTRLADVLVEEGVLDRARVEEAQAEQDGTGRQLGEILIEGEVLTDYDLAKLVATHYALPYLDVASYAMRREVVELLPLEFRTRYAILPLDQFGEMLTLAVSEVPSPELIDQIVEATKLTPILFVALRRGVLNVIEEERKRASNRTSKASAKAAAPAAPKAGPDSQPVTGGGSEDSSLADLDLPTVSMKLAGSAPAGKAPAGGAKPAPAKETGGKPAAGKPGSGGALSWMDAVGKPQAEPANPKISKYGSPAGAAASATAGAAAPAATRPVTGPVKTGAPAAAAAAKSPAPAKSGAPAQQGEGGGAWQSIFDVADESVKKTKPK